MATCVKFSINAIAAKPPQTHANLRPLSTGATNSSISTSTSETYKKVPAASAVKPGCEITYRMMRHQAARLHACRHNILQKAACERLYCPAGKDAQRLYGAKYDEHPDRDSVRILTYINSRHGAAPQEDAAIWRHSHNRHAQGYRFDPFVRQNCNQRRHRCRVRFFYSESHASNKGVHGQHDCQQQGHERCGAESLGVEQPSEVLAMALSVRFVTVVVAMVVSLAIIMLAAICSQGWGRAWRLEGGIGGEAIGSCVAQEENLWDTWLAGIACCTHKQCGKGCVSLPSQFQTCQ